MSCLQVVLIGQTPLLCEARIVSNQNILAKWVNNCVNFTMNLQESSEKAMACHTCRFINRIAASLWLLQQRFQNVLFGTAKTLLWIT